MKQHHWNIKAPSLPALVALALAGSATVGLAVPDRVLGTFDADVSGWGTAWGNAKPSWDPGQDNTGNGGGSCYISADFAADQNTLTVYGCVEGNPWYHPTSANFNLSDYKSIEFDIKWDTNSTVSIADFNTPPQGGEGGIVVWAVDYSAFTIRPTLGTFQVPAAAATGWVHMSLPINPSISGIDPSKGIVFKKWIQAAQMAAGGTYGFWLDNVVLKGTDAPPPPPSLSMSTPVPGLALVAASGGQYDRQNIRTLGTGYSWVGAPGPVTYSVTVAAHADNAHPNFQLQMYFAPGSPDATRADPDWHEPDILSWTINNNANGGASSAVHYKTNAPDDNGILWGAGTLGGANSTTSVGTWSLTFDHDTNLTVTSPSGATFTTNLPPDLVPVFNRSMQIYVGITPGSVDRVGQMAVLKSVKITGAPGAANIDSDFLAQPLDTNVWEVVATTPRGVQYIPKTAAYWLDWTLPATGFSLESASNPAGPWTTPAATGYDLGAKHRVLLLSTDLPAVNAGFWRLIKRPYTKLQVLLPGETAAPGTTTGKTGTPTPQTLGTPFDIVVNAVDDTYHVITSANPTVTISSTDSTFVVPQDAALTAGTRTFNVSFGTTGNWTITATDTADSTKKGTSSSVNAQ